MLHHLQPESGHTSSSNEKISNGAEIMLMDILSRVKEIHEKMLRIEREIAILNDKVVEIPRSLTNFSSQRY